MYTNICPRCSLAKDSSEFYKCKTSKDGFRNWCKLCCNQDNRDNFNKNKDIRIKVINIWRSNNMDKVRKTQREAKKRSRLKDRLRKYGLTENDYNQLLNNCNNSCQICGKLLDSSRKALKPHIDHNHITKKVRGIICHNCNQVLGHSYDTPSLLIKAAEYLKENDNVTSG